jgi:hypothetical protein
MPDTALALQNPGQPRFTGLADYQTLATMDGEGPGRS